MNRIFALIDFTETASITLKQAIVIAKQKGAALTLCHILSKQSEEGDSEVNMEMIPYLEQAQAAGVECEVKIGYGSLFDAVPKTLEEVNPDLVVVGTHGKRGLKQNLFGSDIYKLVKGLNVVTLVLNDYVDVSNEGFKKVMVPVSPHADFMLKVEQTCTLLADGGEIVIFAINKPGVDLAPEILANIEKAKRYLDEVNINWNYTEIDSTRFSLGYSKETLDKVKELEIDLVSIMTNVSGHDVLFGTEDKENMLVNKQGLAVLCSRH